MGLLQEIGWQPQIGDPTVMGWLTVIMYFVAAVLALKTSYSSTYLFAYETVQQQKVFWLIVALTLLFLGINKQLDLQSFFTAIGKYYAHRDGWYENRRIIQISFITAILGLGSIALFVFVYKMKSIIKTNRLAIVGLIFLLLFVIIRAASFHHMDILINTKIWGFRMNWVLELSGIVAITIAALSSLRLYKKH